MNQWNYHLDILYCGVKFLIKKINFKNIYKNA